MVQPDITASQRDKVDALSSVYLQYGSTRVQIQDGGKRGRCVCPNVWDSSHIQVKAFCGGLYHTVFHTENQLIHYT